MFPDAELGGGEEDAPAEDEAAGAGEGEADEKAAEEGDG
jgi:hypothetical protein